MEDKTPKEENSHEDYMDMMKKQLEVMGLDPSEMEEFMENAEGMIKDAAKLQAGELTDNTDEDEEDKDYIFDFEPDEPFIKDISDVENDELLKNIAFGSNLSYLNYQYLNTLETFKPYDQIIAMLAEDWGVNSEEDLNEILEWLEKEGQRKAFEVIWKELKGVPVESWVEKVEKINSNELDFNAVEFVSNLQKGFQSLDEEGGINNFPPNLLSWDLGRAINLVRWGYDVDFLTRKEAESFINRYASKMKEAYNSWEAISEGYILGFMMWAGDEEEFKDLYHAHKILLTHEKSPFVTIPF